MNDCAIMCAKRLLRRRKGRKRSKKFVFLCHYFCLFLLLLLLWILIWNIYLNFTKLALRFRWPEVMYIDKVIPKVESFTKYTIELKIRNAFHHYPGPLYVPNISLNAWPFYWIPLSLWNMSRDIVCGNTRGSYFWLLERRHFEHKMNPRPAIV